jgi:hypothetical protein
VIERNLLRLIPLAVAVTTGCGGATQLEDDPTGPCEPDGRWEVTYTLDEGPDAHAVAQPGTDEIEIVLTAGGEPTVTFNGESPDEFTLSDDGCQVHIERKLFWTAGGEPWSDERVLNLTISGDKASGTLVYGCYWNCGGMHGTLNYKAEAVRVGP